MPVVASAVVLLYAVTVRDVLDGEVHPEREVAHVGLLAGLLLLLLLRRIVGEPPGGTVLAAQATIWFSPSLRGHVFAPRVRA